MLQGYKTYITAGVAIITAIAAYLTGDLGMAEAGQVVLTSVLGATIRSGVKTEAAK